MLLSNSSFDIWEKMVLYNNFGPINGIYLPIIGNVLIRILGKFDADLCVIFLNFQSNPKSNDRLNGIIPQKLHVPSCSFTGRVSASKSLSG